MDKSNSLLSEEELKRVELGEIIGKRYLYTPDIHYEGYETSSVEVDTFRLGIYSDINNQHPTTFTGKVLATQTLWQAVRADLGRIFEYPVERDFAITSAKYFDTVRTNGGQKLTRVKVSLQLMEKLGVSKVFSDLYVRWHDDSSAYFSDNYEETTP